MVYSLTSEYFTKTIPRQSALHSKCHQGQILRLTVSHHGLSIGAETESSSVTLSLSV
jgi:hypothetical protein